MNGHFIRALVASTCFVSVSSAWSQASFAADVPVVADGIGGTVTGAKGPEAGVWVVAETRDMPTRFIKIVVTDDQGRFMLPELPKGKYDVFVRGYGLVDSARVEGTPGKNLQLKSVQAPDAKAAAQYYPANYWEALIRVPAESEFPGTGPKGNGISPTFLTQQQWIHNLKNGCHQCHQLGDAPTRTLIDNTPEGWAERINKARAPGDHVLGNTGQDHSDAMNNRMTSFGRGRSLAMFADWTQRIEKGELPEVPPRPQGVERNFVLTSWDWSNGRYNHDNVSTDRHNPTMNANGPIWGVIGVSGYIESLNPKTLEQSEFSYKVNLNKNVELLGADQTPDTQPHNPMLDRKSRLWLTDRGPYGGRRPGSPEPPDYPSYCHDGKISKSAAYYPQTGKSKNTAVMYDPATKKIEGITMCNDIHHLMMTDKANIMYFSGTGSSIVSWVDIDEWDKSRDPAKSMHWCPLVVDTNSATPTKAAGRTEVSITPDRKQWNLPGRAGPGGEGGGWALPAAAPFDPKKDTLLNGGLYGTDADISDGAMWFAKTSPFPSSIVRFHAGSNPPETCRTEVFEAAKLPDGKNYEGFNIRGMSVDSKGVAWAAFAHGRLGRLDRTKCKVLSGPTATGQHCPEGWSYWDTPGPKMAGVKTGSADFHYLMWVDLHDTLGLGKDVPIVAGSNSDSLLAFDSKTEKFNILRVPYPRSFHTRGMDGRIDDQKTGWKGKGIYATYASQPVWHQEGGDDGLSGPQLVKFQVRPDPLAH